MSRPLPPVDEEGSDVSVPNTTNSKPLILDNDQKSDNGGGCKC